MLEKFRGYIPYTDEEKKSIWENCVFVFDTNFLFDLYRYSISTRDRFFKILDKLNDNIWLPNQVAEEYFKDRCQILYEQHQLYSQIDVEASFSSMKELLKKHKDRHSLIDMQKILEIVDKASGEIKETIKKIEDNDKKIPYNNDDICTKILNLFADKVGVAYNEKELEKIYTEGKLRFKKEIPPGYMDNKKKDNEYGDFIIWKQMISYASKTKKPIVFVTRDMKKDWWTILGGEKIGPRIELTQEMFLKAGVDFLMYNPKQFLEIASNKYSITESGLDKAVGEVEDLEDLEDLDIDCQEKYNGEDLIDNYHILKKNTQLFQENDSFFPYIFRRSYFMDYKVCRHIDKKEFIQDYKKNIEIYFQSEISVIRSSYVANKFMFIFGAVRIPKKNIYLILESIFRDTYYAK